ncbi:Athe_2463 domain-containing protein [Anaerocellum danielii]|uniref:Uncharacterized protein n=1 Tax=Anaerocellum danielii TaxID=1387557 RepID=A0ABZ0U072_9FIRM|nr:hypothetical protein [Caldicellulosiruptor danielii]WPX08869.1 hypothetical protein SOJ16_000026 [Caldicellulosiruptor danielii]
MLIKRRSFLKALSFLCILSLILSIVPPVGIWHSIKAADDLSVYNGGYTSYGGYDYKWWVDNKAKVQDEQENPLYSITLNGKTLYFNCEIYAEHGQVVYGTPDDVPQNHLVSPAGFKPAANGYFYALPHKDAQGNTYYTLATPGTPGAVCGWFRYIGYSKSGASSQGNLNFFVASRVWGSSKAHSRFWYITKTQVYFELADGSQT